MDRQDYMVTAKVTLFTKEYDAEQARLRMDIALKDMGMRLRLDGRNLSWQPDYDVVPIAPICVTGGDSIGL